LEKFFNELFKGGKKIENFKIVNKKGSKGKGGSKMMST